MGLFVSFTASLRLQVYYSTVVEQRKIIGFSSYIVANAAHAQANVDMSRLPAYSRREPRRLVDLSRADGPILHGYLPIPGHYQLLHQEFGLGLLFGLVLFILMRLVGANLLTK